MSKRVKGIVMAFTLMATLLVGVASVNATTNNNPVTLDMWLEF